MKEPIKHLKENEEFKYWCEGCGRLTKIDLWECKNCGCYEIHEVVYDLAQEKIVRKTSDWTMKLSNSQ